MRNIFLKTFAIIATVSLNFSFSALPKIQSLKIGKKAPMTSHKMKDVSGLDLSLEDLA